MKIIVIGGGASGLMAAITAKRNNNEVIILERNNDIAKKILVSGNGRCNYWHDNIDVSSYCTDNPTNLSIILKNKDKVFDYLTSMGLVPRVKDGYYYPLSNQASSVRDLFKYQLTKNNIEIIHNFNVIDIKIENNSFIVIGENDVIPCDKVIIAVGSKAGGKLGSNDNIYNVLKKLGHTINPVSPSLTPLIVSGTKKYNWAGIRTDALLTLVSNHVVIKEERGELQLTNEGISGIVTYNLSGYVARELNKHKDVSIFINFLPDIDNLAKYLETRAKSMGNVFMNELLNSLLNYKLIGLLLHLSHIDGETLYQDLSIKQKERLINNIGNFECFIIDTEGFEKAQVCTGGISLSEINSQTMESLVVPNMYITGEILDVDGECGGYNLAFAFISGYLAGSDIKND